LILQGQPWFDPCVIGPAQAEGDTPFAMLPIDRMDIRLKTGADLRADRDLSGAGARGSL
jgi:hypothetical protein